MVAYTVTVNTLVSFTQLFFLANLCYKGGLMDRERVEKVHSQVLYESKRHK